jgi:hypothetical protein
MLTTTYHYACSTLNFGVAAFVSCGAPQLSPPLCNTLYISKFDLFKPLQRQGSFISLREI